MKNKVATIILGALLVGCATSPQEAPTKKVATENSQVHEIVDYNDYIDLSDSSVKFLFTAKKGDLVNFYIGESETTLKLVHEGVLAGSRGLMVEDLTPNQEYFYKIESIRNNNIVSTELLSFTKKGNTNSWKRAEWAANAVFYQVFVRSFNDGNGDGIGDFTGLKNKIPYLKELGVNALWLMPVNQSPSYHGYDVYDYYNVEMDYGTISDYQALLDEAHKNGIKIIMDLVVNHSSIDHPWFQDAASSVDSPYRDYYVWANDSDRLNKNGPFGGQQWHKTKTGYYNGVFWSGMPDLNFRNSKVREEFKKIALFWLDLGVDGFRLDAALHIDDEDSDVSHSWWREFNTYIKAEYPNALLIGENWASTNQMASYFEDLDSSFNFSFANNLLQMANGQDVDLLENINYIHSIYTKYNKDFIDSTFLANHDQDRTASVLGNNLAKEKLAATLLFTLPGTPFVYYGEELGMLGKKPDDNIREPMDWYKEAKGDGMTTMSKGGFYNSMLYTKANDGISLEEQKGVEDSIFELYKKIIKIRKDYPGFISGDNYEKLNLNDNLYSYTVKSDNNTLLIAHNNKNEENKFSYSRDVEDLLTNNNFNADEIISIPAFSSLVLLIK
ncbi:MAG: hypothetical protein JXR64_10150 [Spirochaetales bacterium]|nr:hypothetical protein [Spirochaetales bacterium]